MIWIASSGLATWCLSLSGITVFAWLEEDDDPYQEEYARPDSKACPIFLARALGWMVANGDD